MPEMIPENVQQQGQPSQGQNQGQMPTGNQNSQGQNQNQTPVGNQSESQQQGNNSGTGADFNSIFSSQEDGNPQTPQGSSSAQSSSESNPPGNQAPAQTATEIMDGLVNGMNFGDGMTQEQYTKFAEGDIGVLNQAMQLQGQNIVRQVLPIVARLLQNTHSNLQESFQTEITSRFDNMMETRSVESELTDLFGFKGNPTMQTLVQTVYKGVLSQAKNDHTKALNMTKDVMAQMGHHINKSLNITTPPESQNVNQGQDFKKLFADL